VILHVSVCKHKTVESRENDGIPELLIISRWTSPAAPLRVSFRSSREQPPSSLSVPLLQPNADSKMPVPHVRIVQCWGSWPAAMPRIRLTRSYVRAYPFSATSSASPRTAVHRSPLFILSHRRGRQKLSCAGRGSREYGVSHNLRAVSVRPFQVL
jgi:hypothetical protein